MAELYNLENATVGDRRIGHFEGFDDHKDKINELGTCQNRKDDVYGDVSKDEYCEFPDEQQNFDNVGGFINLSYPLSDPVDGQ